ncbi:MAG: DNA mismatch repair endonuclease MutL, partial [Nitratireductor sp.]
MAINRLSDALINQIAAGEVVERPSSVVKELMENAIDAGATRIELNTSEGGKNLIRVSDNGNGMSKQDLSLAIQRHCTSKLQDNILDINSLGFRGEALPSIGSIAKLEITSREKGSDNAWSICVDNSKVFEPKPAALSQGTVVKVSGIFSRVPARLKFMKSDRAETSAITEIFKRMALAFPHVHMSVSGSDRATLEYAASDQATRIGQILGHDFIDNALQIDASRGDEKNGVRLQGLVSLPTFNRGNALLQYFYVNGRPVRDKSLLGAVRGAYSDFLPKNRHPVLCLFIDIDPGEVDVNVHPAKADVRFRDAGLVRGLVVGSIKQAVHEAGHRSSSEGGTHMAAAFKTHNSSNTYSANTYEDPQNASTQFSGSHYHASGQEKAFASSWNQPNSTSDFQSQSGFSEMPPSGKVGEGFEANQFNNGAYNKDAQNGGITDEHPLGAARAQLHENYIVSQTENGPIIVDAHAAHERIVYERLKKGMQNGIAAQMLLIPEIIDLPEEDVNRLEDAADSFKQLGLSI